MNSIKHTLKWKRYGLIFVCVLFHRWKKIWILNTCSYTYGWTVSLYLQGRILCVLIRSLHLRMTTMHADLFVMLKLCSCCSYLHAFVFCVDFDDYCILLFWHAIKCCFWMIIFFVGAIMRNCMMVWWKLHWILKIIRLETYGMFV